MIRRARGLGSACTVALLCGCVYLPETTTRYDPECGVYVRTATMQPHQVGNLMGCQDQACAVLLAAAGAVTAASAVISGSVVVVGNVVYWLEKQGRCQGPQRGSGAEGGLPAN